MTGTGETLDCDAANDPDLLEAGRVSLGALGVVSAGSGGGGGAGGSVTMVNDMQVTTHGNHAAGVWALSQGGHGGDGGDESARHHCRW